MLEEYRLQIMEAVAALSAGDVVVLRQLVADWDAIPLGDRICLGEEFSIAVEMGHFPGLSNIGKNARNHQQYRRV